VRDDPIPHRPAVDEKVLQVRLRARYRRQPEPTRQTANRSRHGRPTRWPAEFPAAQLRQPPGAGFPIGRRLQSQYRALVVPQAEPDREPAQRQTADPFLNMTELGALAAQKLAAGRNVEEQIARLDGGAQRMRRRHRLAEDIAAVAPMRQPLSWPAMREVRVNRDTEAMLGNASPRKPRLATCWRSSKLAILLVAWRASASAKSSGWMPPPSSRTRINRTPPCSTSIRDASRAGIQAVFQQFLDDRSRRSTTSPAAIWLTSCGGNRWMSRTHRKAYPAAERGVRDGDGGANR
jgi:hypothetical protein